MAATNINIRIDSELKAKARSVFKDLGLDMSTAINIFLSQVVLRQAIPFEIAMPGDRERKMAGDCSAPEPPEL